jgi:hypothetical protein
MSQARCLLELVYTLTQTVNNTVVLITTRSTQQKASQTIISLPTVCYTIHTDLGKAYIKSYTVCTLLTRSLGSDVVNDFIARLWVLLINKNVKWTADENAETMPPQFLQTCSM